MELHCFTIPCIARPGGGGANKESATVSFLQLSHRYTKTRMTQSDALAFEKPGN